MYAESQLSANQASGYYGAASIADSDVIDANGELDSMLRRAGIVSVDVNQC